MSRTPADLVLLAREGDAAAWDELVQQFHPLLWRVARSHGLSTAEAADVVQVSWLRLVENLPRLREPARVQAWLVTTARRESLAVLRRSQRSIPSEDPARHVAARADERPEHAVDTAARDELLHAAFARLGDRCRTLLAVLCSDPPLSYEEVSSTLDMPIGSIGPTRARCLEQLRSFVPAGITWA